MLVELGAVVGEADHADGAAVLDAVGEIGRGEHRDAGDGHRAHACGRDHGDLPLGDARQHDDDAIALSQTELGEQVRQAGSGGGDVGVGEALFVAGVVDGDQREALGVVGPAIDHVGREVERVGHVPLEGVVDPLVVCRQRQPSCAFILACDVGHIV